MKTTISKNEFVQMFNDYNRADSFTVAGREALYDWLEMLEDDTGTEQEVDIIALCCEFSEYENLEELQQNYTNIENMQDLEDNTIVIMIDDESFIIQDF